MRDVYALTLPSLFLSPSGSLFSFLFFYVTNGDVSYFGVTSLFDYGVHREHLFLGELYTHHHRGTMVSIGSFYFLESHTHVTIEVQ